MAHPAAVRRLKLQFWSMREPTPGSVTPSRIYFLLNGSRGRPSPHPARRSRFSCSHTGRRNRGHDLLRWACSTEAPGPELPSDSPCNWGNPPREVALALFRSDDLFSSHQRPLAVAVGILDRPTWLAGFCSLSPSTSQPRNMHPLKSFSFG